MLYRVVLVFQLLQLLGSVPSIQPIPARVQSGVCSPEVAALFLNLNNTVFLNFCEVIRDTVIDRRVVKVSDKSTEEGRSD